MVMVLIGCEGFQPTVESRRCSKRHAKKVRVASGHKSPRGRQALVPSLKLTASENP